MRRLLLIFTLALTFVTSASAGRVTREIHRLWPGQESTARCVIYHESHWQSRAINWRDQHRTGRGSFGLMQIGRDWVTRYLHGNWHRALDPVVNVRLGRKVYDAQGWYAWAGYRYCH